MKNTITKEELIKLCGENGWDGVINEDGTITLTNRNSEAFWQCAEAAGFTVAGNTISARDIYRRTKLEADDTRKFLLECTEESANSIAEEYIRESWDRNVHPDIARILKEAEEVQKMLQKMKENIYAADDESVLSTLKKTGKKFGITVRYEISEDGTDRYVFFMPGASAFCVDIRSCFTKERSLREIAEQIPGTAAKAAGFMDSEDLCYVCDAADRFVGELLYGGKDTAGTIRAIAEDLGLNVFSYKTAGQRVYNVLSTAGESILMTVDDGFPFGREMGDAADILEEKIQCEGELLSDGFIEDLKWLTCQIRSCEGQRVPESEGRK